MVLVFWGPPKWSRRRFPLYKRILSTEGLKSNEVALVKQGENKGFSWNLFTFSLTWLEMISNLFSFTLMIIECFLIECRETKPKFRRKGCGYREYIFKSQWELKVKKTKLSIGRENAGDQVMIGFSFASDWLSEWWSFSGPITEHCYQVKPKQSLVAFDTRLKTAVLVALGNLRKLRRQR